MSDTYPISTLEFSDLIGIPYSEKDCWGIAVEFYSKVFKIQLKNYYEQVPESRDIAKDIVYSSVEDFKEVTVPLFGDLILIKLHGVESHIAIYLGEGRMLHTTIHSGCVIDRLKRWEKLVVGYYRVRTND